MALTPTISRDPFVSLTAFDGEYGPVLIDNTQALNVGDLLVFDAALGSNGLHRAPVTQADMLKYVGVSMQQNPIQSLGDKLLTVNFWKQARLAFKTTNAETYIQWQPVFFNENADVQTVTNNNNAGARTTRVGYVVIPQQLQGGGISSVVGAPNVLVHVVITPIWPAAAY